ncbi:AMP-binding protein [Microbacterium sp. A93]|uniref:AMP-binding protein n=1 Tax=Microbacterium sp. A93 TaxID=3450716 RepID=UPI003F42AC17
MSLETVGATHGTHAGAIRGALHRRPERVAFEENGREITYGATADRIARIMRVLSQSTDLNGAAVGVLSTNRSDAWMTAIATSMAGGKFVALGARNSAEDLVYMCDDSGIDVLVVDPELDDLASSVLQLSNRKPRVFGLGGDAIGPDLLAAAESVGSTRLVVSPLVQAKTPSKILYTGGTTGRPKGVIITQEVDLSNSSLPLAVYGMPRRARSLVSAPMTHAGNPITGSTLLGGGTVIVEPTFTPDSFVHAIEHRGVNSTVGVPTMIYAIQDYAEGRNVDFSSLQHFLYAASPISPTRLASAQERWGSIFVQVYSGMELAGIGSILHADEHDLSDPSLLASAGRAMPHVQMLVMDPKGNPMPTGETGEIWVRGHGLFAGYVNMPDAYAEAMEGGWYHTGDIARMDEQGYFTIVDRMKDVIMTGGFSVFSREVEDALTAHTGVHSAAAIGVPDDYWGEAVKAIVVRTPGVTATAEEIITHVKALKGGVAAPKSVDFVDSLPLTPAGKVDKKVLRAEYWTQENRNVN